MNKRLLLALIITSFSFLPSQSFSQSRLQMFLELGGFSKSYSANIAYQIQDQKRSEGFLRLGLGVEDNRLVLPLGYVYLRGRRDHFLEISGGMTVWSEGIKFWNRTASDILVNLNLGVAYRYQPFRASYYVSLGLFPFLRLDPSPNGIEAGQIAAGFKPGFSLGYRIR